MLRAVLACWRLRRGFAKALPIPSSYLLSLSFLFFGGYKLHQSQERHGEYVYNRLQDADHIRIIELLPAKSETNHIYCRIHHTSRTQPIFPYTAISYVWGKESDKALMLVYIDGRSIRISKNLHSIFTRLRHHEHSRFLWADALCIDQGTHAEALAEKEQQVQSMDRTFSNAAQVVIDLGEMSAAKVLPTLDRFFDIPDSKWEQAHRAAITEDLKSCFDCLFVHNLPDVEDPFWQSFVGFMQRPWFLRVWIIQEYALAAQSVFLVGRETRAGSYLPNGIIRALQYMVFLYVADRYEPKNGIANNEFARVVWDMDPLHTAVLLIKEARQSRTTGLSLDMLLWRIKRFQCTKPRDKIYAILGLVEDPAVKLKIPVDYNKDDETIHPVAMQAARYLIESWKGPYVLYNCLGIESGHESWEPLLSEPNLDALAELYRPEGVVENGVYKACGDTSFTFGWKHPATTHTSADDRILLVKGVVVDTVSCFGPSLPHRNKMAHKDVQGNSPWVPDTRDWMCSVHHLQSLPLSDFIIQGWTAVFADLIVPPQGGGRGFIRTRDVGESALCIEAIDNAARQASLARKLSDEEFRCTMPLDQFRKYLAMMSESFRFSIGRKLALTETRRLTCSVPRETETDDVICIILGCPIPFVLRRVGQCYRILGCCYVHGLMDGEALTMDFWKEEAIELR